jgi:hypothetical protein
VPLGVGAEEADGEGLPDLLPEPLPEALAAAEPLPLPLALWDGVGLQVRVWVAEPEGD